MSLFTATTAPLARLKAHPECRSGRRYARTSAPVAECSGLMRPSPTEPHSKHGDRRGRHENQILAHRVTRNAPAATIRQSLRNSVTTRSCATHDPIGQENPTDTATLSRIRQLHDATKTNVPPGNHDVPPDRRQGTGPRRERVRVGHSQSDQSYG
jgi:hypothetical protein